MILLGINAYHGDASAVVLADGKPLFAIEEERLNRIKHSAGLPAQAVKEILRGSRYSREEIDGLSISRSSRANLLSKLAFVLKSQPPLSFLKERLSVSGRSRDILRNPGEFLGGNGAFRAKGFPVEHHLSHAASAFYPSGFERAALLTVDGFGDFSSTMFGIGEGNRIRALKRVLFPHSLGVLYTAATQYLGFLSYGDEYKVMGLAAYGEPRFLNEFRQLLRLESDGAFRLNLDYFLHPRGKVEMTWSEGEPVLSTAYSERWHSLFGPPRLPEEPITQRDKDLAASIQAIFEETFFHLLRHLYERTRIKKLCLAGGCAFNSVANGKIFDHTAFEEVYIQPAAGDAGTALGSALYVQHHQLNQLRNFVMEHAYWGPEFNEKDIEETIRTKNEDLKNAGCFVEKIQTEGRGEVPPALRAVRPGGTSPLLERVAQAIAEGKIVGWFQGRMEWGPRALGNRSILADPRRAEMRELLNSRIKLRESFRPFAPSVLEEKASEWFEMKTSKSPFMNLVFPVRSDKRTRIPAITHVDGTARVHTVSPAANPLFWNLIHHFEKITGVPLVLNTSFNENEPIVCTPSEALNCFLRTRMDVLVLGRYWIERKRD